jgi:uncharacterized protein (TIGR02246 family)
MLSPKNIQPSLFKHPSAMKAISKRAALLLLSFFSLNLTAQSAADEAAIKTFWRDVWNAFETGNEEAMWAAYTEAAQEIGPDGSLVSGKKAIKENWAAMMKMVDAPPTFTYQDLQVRMLNAEFAIIIWDSSADIKVQGQQVGGKTKGMALLRKIGGRWLIEFDSITPVMPPPPVAPGK